jgi:hypothetical protein
LFGCTPASKSKLLQSKEEAGSLVEGVVATSWWIAMPSYWNLKYYCYQITTKRWTVGVQRLHPVAIGRDMLVPLIS